MRALLVAFTLLTPCIAWGQGLPPGSSPPIVASSNTALTTMAGAVSGGLFKVTDTNNATYAGVVSITPGTAVAAQRSLAYVCTGQGTVTLTYADASTMTVTLPANGYPFSEIAGAFTNVALGSATGCTFWNRK